MSDIYDYFHPDDRSGLQVGGIGTIAVYNRSFKEIYEGRDIDYAFDLILYRGMKSARSAK